MRRSEINSRKTDDFGRRRKPCGYSDASERRAKISSRLPPLAYSTERSKPSNLKAKKGIASIFEIEE
jgi:hypothetical protein